MSKMSKMFNREKHRTCSTCKRAVDDHFFRVEEVSKEGGSQSYIFCPRCYIVSASNVKRAIYPRRAFNIDIELD